MGDGLPIGSSGNGMVDGGYEAHVPQSENRRKRCHHCRGAGEFPCRSQDQRGRPNCEHICETCKGTGEVEDE